MRKFFWLVWKWPDDVKYHRYGGGCISDGCEQIKNDTISLFTDNGKLFTDNVEDFYASQTLVFFKVQKLNTSKGTEKIIKTLYNVISRPRFRHCQNIKMTMTHLCNYYQVTSQPWTAIFLRRQLQPRTRLCPPPCSPWLHVPLLQRRIWQ